MEITNREKQILNLITQELTSKEIANKLFLSIETINSHRKNMMAKLQAKNTAGLVAKAYRSGIMIGTACIALLFFNPTIGATQTRNLEVEGSGDQLAVIGTTTQGVSTSGIELTRGSEFNSTDWRIINNGGLFQLADGTDNFATPGITNFEINSAGVVRIFNGSDAILGNNSSGSLLIGQPASHHLAIDNNGIIARNNTGNANLLLQTGPDKGNTLLNNLSGNVGIGTVAPVAKLGIEDNGFQLRFVNREQLTNEWFIGASHSGWGVGGDRLVISPTESSSDAMLILDREEEIISARSNRITSVEDPINDRDAVNLRTLRALAQVNEMSTLENNLNLRECSRRCRILTEGGHSDWKIPSLEEAVQFVDLNQGNGFLWTSSFGGKGTVGSLFENATFYLSIDLNDGQTRQEGIQSDLICRCVR